MNETQKKMLTKLHRDGSLFVSYTTYHHARTGKRTSKPMRGKRKAEAVTWLIEEGHASVADTWLDTWCDAHTIEKTWCTKLIPA